MKQLSNFLTEVPEVKMLDLPKVKDLRVVNVGSSYRVFDFSYLKSITPSELMSIFSDHKSASNLSEWSESEMTNALKSGMRISREYIYLIDICLNKVNPYEVNFYLNVLDEIDVNPRGTLCSGVIKDSDSTHLTEDMSYFIFDSTSMYLTNSLEDHSDKESSEGIPMIGVGNKGTEIRVDDSWTLKEYRNQSVLDSWSLTKLYTSYSDMNSDLKNLSTLMNKAFD